MPSTQFKGRLVASELLQGIGKVVDFGDDVGSSNVVKLCGNFLIASSIESIGARITIMDYNSNNSNNIHDNSSKSILICYFF